MGRTLFLALASLFILGALWSGSSLATRPASVQSEVSAPPHRGPEPLSGQPRSGADVSGDESRVPIRKSFSPSTSVVGRTVDPHGQPLSGVEVELVSREQAPASTTSKKDGTFAFAPGLSGTPRATREGWVTLRRSYQVTTGDGVELVLVPAGELALTVVNAEGRPRAGVLVQLELAPAEAAIQPPRRRTTDDEGRAVFEDLPTLCRLRVLVDNVSYAWRTGARLLHPEESPPDASRLWVTAIAHLELTLRQEPARSLRGAVRDDQGAAAPRAHVLAMVDGTVLGNGRCNSLGEFEIRLSSPTPYEEIQLVAREAASEGSPGTFGVKGVSRPVPGDPRAHDIVVHGTHRVRGRVEGPHDSDRWAEVVASPLDQELPWSRDPQLPPWMASASYWHSYPLRTSAEEGHFELDLPPGLYELEASSTCDCEVRVEVESDSGEPILLNLVPRPTCRLVLHFDAGDQAHGDYLYQVGSRASGEVRTMRTVEFASRLPAVDGTTVESLDVAFGLASLGHGRQIVRRDPVRRNAWSLRTFLTAEPTLEVDVPRGVVQVDGLLELADGSRGRPVSTGPLRTDGSLHHVHLSPPATGAVAGRWREPMGEDLLVRLVHPVHGPISLPPASGTRRSPGDRIPTDRELDLRGRFHLGQVPEGSYTLELGTDAELESGRPRHEAPIMVVAGETSRHDLPR